MFFGDETNKKICGWRAETDVIKEHQIVSDISWPLYDLGTMRQAPGFSRRAVRVIFLVEWTGSWLGDWFSFTP